MNRVHVVHGDITKMDVDAIVNAANERMLGGGGVDGAIHRAAGPQLLAACRRVPEVSPGVRCPVGSARITDGFALRSRYVIHTVGPVWFGGSQGEHELLAACYKQCLLLAKDHHIATIAFPAISCGVYRFPPEQAAVIAAEQVYLGLRDAPDIQAVYLVAFQQAMVRIMQNAVDQYAHMA